MKILFADDHVLVRDAIVALLDQEDDFEITTVDDLQTALAESVTGYDLILLDYSMPGMNGLSGFDKMKGATKAPVALLTGSASREVAQQALDNGAAGFLPKTMSGPSLINAIRFMAAGEIYAPISFLQGGSLDAQSRVAKSLTTREKQVLSGLVRGLSNKEIAREVSLQEVTVKLHVKTTCRKLGARNRTQAAIAAKEAGLF